MVRRECEREGGGVYGDGGRSGGGIGGYFYQHFVPAISFFVHDFRYGLVLRVPSSLPPSQVSLPVSQANNVEPIPPPTSSSFLSLNHSP